MSLELQRIDEAANAIKARLGTLPKLVFVAGSGLGALASIIEDAQTLNYAEIPNFKVPKVAGHSGQLVVGRLGNKRVAVLSGRVHAYEGYAMADVVYAVRAIARAGGERFFITNAAGGINPWSKPGTLTAIVDHINCSGKNPLVGENIADIGPRFPDMSAAYCPVLTEELLKAAGDCGIALQTGVYACMSGPSYETPAEIRMLRAVGADLVGMSTVYEVLALRHMGKEVCAMSVVTNYAAGVSSDLLDHSEVKDVANQVGPQVLKLATKLAERIG